MKTRQETDTRLARAWYIQYPLDAFALGPYRYDRPKTAFEVAEEAHQQFGEYPAEIWPEGMVEETEEYEYTLQESSS